jgi:hypothetical protein
MANMSGISGALWGSPRRQRRLLWVSGAVLLAGLAAILATVVFKGTGNAFPDKFSNKPAQVSTPEKRAPVSAAEIALARRFIETAVARKDLDTAYSFVHPDLRGGLTRAQWDRGNIPVLYYQADNAKTVGFKVDYSYQSQALFEVNLHARPGTETRPSLLFFLGLKREGGKSTGRWLVNYFEPNWRPPIPMAPG